ncbi:MAG: response regulator [Alkalispirochaeta sp.]
MSESRGPEGAPWPHSPAAASRGPAGDSVEPRSFSVVIVDDEAVVREGVRDRVDWKSLGFSVAGDYEDGRAALEAVRAAPPDVILTDIRMPFVDGIELTRTVAREFPAVRVLLLTGHDEFEYAQEAVRLQVWDFLLKPISSRELSVVLERLATELCQEDLRQREDERLRRQWEESVPLLRQRTLNDLLSGAEPVTQVFARLDELEIAFPAGRVRVVLVSPDPPDTAETDDSPGIRNLAIANLTAELCTDPWQAVQVSVQDSDIAIIVAGPDPDLQERADLLRRTVVERGLGSVTIAVGPAYGRLHEVRESYHGARRRLAQRFLTGGNRVIADEGRVESPPDASREAHPSGDSPLPDLEVCIRNVNRSGARAALTARVEACRRRKRPIPMCILILQRDLARVLDAAEALEVDSALFLTPHTNPFEELARLPSLDAIHRWFSQLLDTVFNSLEERVRNQAEVKVHAAEMYLRDHFREPGLSLTEVCAELSVSVSYFSQRFKSITGKTFVEYLTELRIEHAKELLRTASGRGYEIAPQVGFRDPHYFSSTFKKVCGMTPTQYRAQFGRDSS